MRITKSEQGGEVNKMTQIILARHGETEWNAREIFRGRIDVELNETGIRQAELLAKYLSAFRIEAIYSSPLRRASTTAETVGRYHEVKVQIAPALIDFDYGKWQGLSHEEVKKKYKALYEQWTRTPHQVAMPGGESLADVSKRAFGMVQEALTGHQNTVVLVSHRVVNKVLICALLGLDNSHFWNIKQDTCGITTFTCEDQQFILTEHNNTSYLKPLQKTLPATDF